MITIAPSARLVRAARARKRADRAFLAMLGFSCCVAVFCAGVIFGERTAQPRRFVTTIQGGDGHGNPFHPPARSTQSARSAP